MIGEVVSNNATFDTSVICSAMFSVRKYIDPPVIPAAANISSSLNRTGRSFRGQTVLKTA